MDQLAIVLESFNRKERNLLIRDILGHLPLSSDFCERLAKLAGISKESLESAWWATDFHFDWLAGALLTFMKGEKQGPQDNASMVVMGSPEDLDVIVAAHDPDPKAETRHHLILIEAKAYGYFSTDQYQSKAKRLELLYEFYERLEKESKHRIRFHYFLLSRTEPTKLVLEPLPWRSGIATVPKDIHLEIKLPGSSLRVVRRCDSEGKTNKNGGHWTCDDPLVCEDAGS